LASSESLYIGSKALFSNELLFSNLLNRLQLEIKKNKIAPNT